MEIKPRVIWIFQSGTKWWVRLTWLKSRRLNQGLYIYINVLYFNIYSMFHFLLVTLPLLCILDSIAQCVGVEIKKRKSRDPKNTAVHTEAKISRPSSFYSCLLQLAVNLYIISKNLFFMEKVSELKQPLHHRVAVCIHQSCFSFFEEPYLKLPLVNNVRNYLKFTCHACHFLLLSCLFLTVAYFSLFLCNCK